MDLTSFGAATPRLPRAPFTSQAAQFHFLQPLPIVVVIVYWTPGSTTSLPGLQKLVQAQLSITAASSIQIIWVGIPR